MTREIKFRAWDKKDKSMIREVFEIGLGDRHNPETWLVGDDRQVTNFELMQYTGLKDINGKEIYEDDFVMLNNTLYQIFFNKKYAAFQLKHKHHSGEFFTHFFFEITGTIKVVGNIYENPELLAND